MKKFFAILICKVVHFGARLFGRGTSLPGKIAEEICPGILGKIKFQGQVVAVTGSNGKTSTAELLTHIIRECGHSVVTTKESNQSAGIATAILTASNLFGTVKADFVILESEERHSKNTYKAFVPDYFVITNLLRDQLTRNGHSEFVASCVAEAINPKMHLILNADDPMVSALSKLGTATTWFGVAHSAAYDNFKSTYDDGLYCPLCLSKMEYKYHVFSHYGKYNCTSCAFTRRPPEFELTEFDRKTGQIVINDKYSSTLSFVSIMTAYNVLAAFSTAVTLGLSPEKCVEAVSSFVSSIGRVKEFNIGDVPGTLLISKHENSTSYNLSLDYIARSGTPCSVVFILEDISRKYFTADTSWLWDIDFARLANSCVKQIIVSGDACHALAQRLEYVSLPDIKIIIEPDTSKIGEHIDPTLVRQVFCPTGFSDRAKLVTN